MGLQQSPNRTLIISCLLSSVNNIQTHPLLIIGDTLQYYYDAKVVKKVALKNKEDIDNTLAKHLKISTNY